MKKRKRKQIKTALEIVLSQRRSFAPGEKVIPDRKKEARRKACRKFRYKK